MFCDKFISKDFHVRRNMGIFSFLFGRKKEDKLTKEQIDKIEEKMQETLSKYNEPSIEEVPTISQFKKHLHKRQKSVKKIQLNDKKNPKKELKREFVKTGIEGFDSMIENGIPKGASVLISGGAGSGKTILCLNIAANASMQGEKCLYLSFEESEERLKQHMEDFGWDWKTAEKNGNLRIIRKDPFLLTGSIEAMLASAKGELLIDLNEILEILPRGFEPDRIVLDSLSAIAAAFSLQEESYRIFIEQLFRYFESLNATTFLISETEQMPTKYSKSGEEEFLADGVIVLYNIRKGDTRISAIEVLKMRGVNIKKKIVPFAVQHDKGIEVYPKETVFAEI